ncbi:TPA: Gfo/Idh/MocA family oxidoreductase [Candidatus Poribacteria bacterium]|nr:Gfo/Idh/MocA family oxidoreductase [Candidatus Poribacteria bacterium]HEX29911.1 Gfo/Idh/MocA family oxidoreductase [Candidatus Poribacteria bacterium]
MGERFRVGMIGCGGIANRHAKVLSGIEEVELMAFCDIVEEKAAEFNQRYGEGKGKVYTNFARMFDSEDLDVVWICLPPFAHTNEVELAAEHGVHVFIEKPIALDMETAGRMVEAVDKHGVKSQVGFMSRFGEAIERVKGMLEEGDAGEPGLMIGKYMCNSLHSPWWRDKSKSGGQIVEQIIHTYDIIRYFLGEPESVFCQADNIFHKNVENYTSEDVSATVIRFRNGAIATVAGTNGAIPGRWISQYELVARNITVNFADPNNALLYRTNVQPPQEMKLTGSKDLFLAEAMDLLNAIKEDGNTRTPIIEGAKTLELVLGASRSAETGKIVEF